MTAWPIVGVAGARGVVGGVFCSILADAGLPAECLRAFGSGEGKTLDYQGQAVDVHVLNDERAKELDVLFLAVDGEQSREIMAGPGRLVPLVVDNSSAFRLADDVPLVVPEANAHAGRERTGNLIANPNCTTAAAVVALAPIRDAAGLASVDLASYQAVSGAGRKGLDAFWLVQRGGYSCVSKVPTYEVANGRLLVGVLAKTGKLDGIVAGLERMTGASTPPPKTVYNLQAAAAPATTRAASRIGAMRGAPGVRHCSCGANRSKPARCTG